MKPLMLLLVVLLATPPDTFAQDAATVAIVGGRTTYVVRPGDTLASICARYAVSRATLIELNDLASQNALAPGQTLIVDNTHIASVDPHVSVTINIPQRLLFIVENQQARAFPITVGRTDWPTPVGAFTIVGKETNPVWDVPLSIQREMAEQGRPVITRMEPSALNPLGAHWIGLSIPGLGIHGTNAPSSIYGFASHGCIRMHPEDVAALFDRVTVGTTGVLTYQPVIIAVVDERVWLEVHRDAYRRAPDAARYVRAVIEHHGLSSSVDWDLIDQLVRLRHGRAVDVTAPAGRGLR